MNAMADLILEEGWGRIGGALTASLLLALLDCELLSFVFLAGAGLLVWSYRRPVRTVSHFDAGSVTSPCDGSVTAVETQSDGSIVVEIETGYLDASLLTAPFETTVLKRTLVRGARLRQGSTLRASLNENGSLLFEDHDGNRVHVTHTLLRGAAPLVLDPVPTVKHLMRGTRYGVMLHGLTRIHLPDSARVAVNPGETVRATETLLGYIG